MRKHILGVSIILGILCTVSSFSENLTIPLESSGHRETFSFSYHAMNSIDCQTNDAPSIEWVQKIGRYDSDYARSVQQTRDGGYIIAGFTYSFGSFGDIWLIKTDSQGQVTWIQSYGGTREDYGYSVQETPDGGYIIVGYTLSFGEGNKDIWLIKTDPDGEILWQKTYGGITIEWGHSVDITSDGGYIIAGFKGNNQAGDAWVLKVDSQGNLEWEKTLGGGTARDTAESIEQTSDGGYIITGYTESRGAGNNVWLIKMTPQGDIQWETTYGGPSGGYSAHQTSDGGYVIAGWTKVSHSNEAMVIKTNHEGKIEYQKTYGCLRDDYGFSIHQTFDDGYILVGYTYQNPEQKEDILVIRTDSKGETLWNLTYGGINSDWAWAVQQTNDGGYIIAGDTWSADPRFCHVWLIKMAAEALIPNQPSTPHGPTRGVNDVQYSYTTETIDPLGYEVKYYYDWGDGTGNWTQYVPSGQSSPAQHKWTNPGTYSIRSKAQNSDGAYSRWSSPLTLVISRNNPPQTPRRPMGSESGKINEIYSYSTSTIDSDGDEIYYLFDWGDGTDSDWLGPYPSGETVTASHTWSRQGTYQLQVKARDSHTMETDWSEPLVVSMPKTHPTPMKSLYVIFWEFINHFGEHLFSPRISLF